MLYSTVENPVHPDELQRVEDSIRAQIAQQKEASGESKQSYEDYVEYRILTKKGTIRNVIDMGGTASIG